MKIKTKKDKRSNLDKEIDALLKVLDTIDPSSEQYKDIALNVKTLCEAKATDKSKKWSVDTVAPIAANLLGIVLILSYEQWAPITSKALTFVIRGRV